MEIHCTLEIRPAEKTAGGWSYWPMSDPAKVVPVTASSLGDLADRMAEAAHAFGQHAVVFAKLPKGARAPRGWNTWITKVQTFYEHTGAPAPASI